jgi:HAD superfamily hydrolase (TIGR01509 family)
MKQKFIIIPLGGLGNRYKKENYINPKALITTNNKCIIYWLLDNIKISNNYTILIPYNEKEYESLDLETKLQTRYPNIKFKFFPLKNNTRGAVETISICLQKFSMEKIIYPILGPSKALEEQDGPVICIDSDNFYLQNIIEEWNEENKIFVFEDIQKNPIFSYVKKDADNNLLEIIEKEKISNLACCGAYGFSSIYSLHNYCLKIINNQIYQKDEFYTSGLVQLMLKDNIQFKVSTILNKNYFTLGVPENLRKFETVFLLDLDGTLVSSDPIYVEVWKEILIKYNLKANENFFNYFIKGRCDDQVLKYIFPNITDALIQEISILKDELFSQKVTRTVLFDGVKEFFEKIKNSYIAVVTSSNKKAAQTILFKTGLSNYVNLLIASEDCIKHKPNPEPYNNALKQLGLKFKNIIIFEDSYSGYSSAKQITSNLFIKLSHDNSQFEANKFNEYNEINDPYKLNQKKEGQKFNNIIKYLPIKKILKSSKNLKTGYICNIDLYELIYNDNTKQCVVLKLNNDGNVLSETAKKLDMYQKEVKFYRDISHGLNINVPKCFHIINTEKYQGMLLENLLYYKGEFDCNLNNNIKHLFTVIKEICSLHLRFKFETSNNVIESMKGLNTVKEITHYYELVKVRYLKFRENVKYILTNDSLAIFDKIKSNFEFIGNELSLYPLSFCHGDYKSPNIFYKEDNEIVILDWQYIHLGKGVSDLVFLLVESIDFDETLCSTIRHLYYKLYSETDPSYSFNQFEYEFNLSLCMFPFFVCVWFNSEEIDKLIDSTFPLRFLRNLDKYYQYYLKDFNIKKTKI